MALIRAMRNGCSPRLFGMGSKVDEKTLCTESADKPLANAHQTKDWVASTTSLMPLIQKCIAGTASTSAKQNRVASTNRAPRTPACRMA